MGTFALGRGGYVGLPGSIGKSLFVSYVLSQSDRHIEVISTHQRSRPSAVALCRSWGKGGATRWICPEPQLRVNAPSFYMFDTFISPVHINFDSHLTLFDPRRSLFVLVHLFSILVSVCIPTSGCTCLIVVIRHSNNNIALTFEGKCIFEDLISVLPGQPSNPVKNRSSIIIGNRDRSRSFT